jgi:hypothetical protein
MLIHQKDKDMFPYNKTDNKKMRLIRSVAVPVTMMIMINRNEKPVNRWVNKTWIIILSALLDKKC